LNLGAIADKGRGHGLAEIHIQTGITAIRTQETKARDLATHATKKFTPLLHQVQPGTIAIAQGGASTEQTNQAADGTNQTTRNGSGH
jgi:hypothetical protein